MDDEAADIQLLDQYLHKTSQISQRMTSILKKFDDRLKHLEKSILPLHTSTQALTRLADNIDSTLHSIDKAASSHDDIAAEEALILRGPRSADLATYIDALERLNANLAFGSSSSTNTAQVVETGAKKLAQLYTKLVAEASSSSPIDPLSHLPSPPNPFPTIPASILTSLTPLVAALRALPLPATHPSHPAAAQIFRTLKEAQKGYAEMRGGTWGKKCLEPLQRGILGQIETASDGGGLAVAAQICEWVEALVALAEAECETLESSALLPAAQQTQQTFAALCNPLITMFASMMATVQTSIKKSLISHVWLAFGLYAGLAGLQPAWDDVMRGRTGRKENELSETAHALRGMCLRSFPEFLVEVKQAAMPPMATASAKQFEIGTGIAEISKTVVDYLSKIPDMQSTIEATLRILGDGNWKMGEGPMAKQVADREVTDHVLLEHFSHDVIVTLTTTLTALSKTQKRAALSSIFLLNNISYLRAQLLLEPQTPVDDFVSTATQSHLNSQYRTAKATYFEANFTVLLSSLNDDKKAGKSGTKEKFATFFDSLEEVAERHRFARVLGDDPSGREGLADDVVRLVIPALQGFLRKGKAEAFSKNPSKYIKATPEEVEAQIRNFYR